jgi:hypothetical protein
MTRGKKWLLGATIAIAALVVFAVVYVRTHPLVFNESMWGHAHCIPAAVLGFHEYADRHEGRFPHHPRGYGNALLLMDEMYYPNLTGPGYDTNPFLEAKRNGTDLAEEDCGRVYVQGLSLKTKGGASNIVILFDKLPTPGGDHMPLPGRMWAPLGREVCYANASHRFIPETDWLAFAAEQIDLLDKEGIPRAEAERLYASKPKQLP